MASREEEGGLMAGASHSGGQLGVSWHQALGTHGRLVLEGPFTSLFPELEAEQGAASQLADLPFLP